jgi:hypothetical protein
MTDNSLKEKSLKRSLHNMSVQDEFVDEIYHKMEYLILNEIEYSKKNGYSGRARRYMKRKLNKELEEFFENRTESAHCTIPENTYDSDHFDSDDSELLIKRDKCNFCLGVMCMATLISFYTVFGFIIYRYQSCLVPQL